MFSSSTWTRQSPSPRINLPRKANWRGIRSRKINSQLRRIADTPVRRGPEGWMQTMSTLVAHTPIIESTSEAAKAP
jgi:hypothetical protein